MLIAGILVGLFSVFLLVQDVLVHLHCVYADDDSIAVVGPLARMEIRWSEVTERILKERRNTITITDHLLILRGRSDQVIYNTSTLSRNDEKRLLELVRSNGPLLIEQSKPSI